MSSPANGLVDAIRNMENNSLPVRIAQLYQRIGSPFQNMSNEVRSLLGMSQPAQPEDEYHRDQVRNAFKSFGMKSPDVTQMKKPLEGK